MNDLLRGVHHTLVLFGGPTPNSASWQSLTSIAQAVRGKHGENMQVHIIVDGTNVPKELPGDVDVLLDTEGAAHHRYQADLPSLYLIRPDGYIGFRSRPAEHTALISYLPRIFK